MHPELSALVVCSDSTTVAGADERVEGDPFAGPSDTPVTTNPYVVAGFLDRAETGLKVIFTTYHSGPVIAEGMRVGASRDPFDLLVADEAHRLAGSPRAAFRVVLDDGAIPASRRLFMTATPVLLGALGSDDDRTGRLSMDNSRVFGSVPVAVELP